MCLFPYCSSDETVLIENYFNSLSADNVECRRFISSTVPSASNPDYIKSNSYFKNVLFPKSRTVYYDQFLEINCDYVSPNDLTDAFLDTNIEDLVIYHNNIRSLKKNFMKVQDEIFNNCSMFVVA